MCIRDRMKSVLEEGDQVDPALVERLGIEKDWLNRFPVEISGGEMQRFCIARAMGKRTRFLLADEISTMLDLITQSQIWHFLIEETRRRQMGMIVVSHSPEPVSYTHLDVYKRQAIYYGCSGNCSGTCL